MAKNIDTSPIKIGNFLKIGENCVFVVPEYQRPYSWRIENCDKLWQDINYFIENKTNECYFFGTIILSCQDSDTRLELIDGQQRTTTFLLLLKALLIVVNDKITEFNSYNDESSGLLTGLKSRRQDLFGILYKVDVEHMPEKPNIEKDAIIYEKANILENKSNSEQFKKDLNAILGSKDFMDAEQKVAKIRYKKKDNAYSNFFKNFKFFYNKLKDLDSSKINNIAKIILNSCEVIQIKSWNVEQAITMFNSLNSDGLPLNDADILSAKLFAESKGENKGDVFSQKWKELLEVVESLSSKGILNIDSILGQYMYITRAKNGEIVSSTGGVNVTVPGVRRYFTIENQNIIRNPITTCSQMLYLAKIWNIVVNIPVVSILLKFNDNAKFFLGCYFSRFFDRGENLENFLEKHESEIEKLSKAMLKLFAILELVDAGYSSSYFKTFLFRESADMVNKDIDVIKIDNDFSKHINSNFKINSIKASIKDYDKNLLVCLNEYVLAINDNLKFNLGGKYDVEHIMPASGHNISAIQIDAKIKNKEEFDEFVNKIGNKILLEEKINRSISNDWFRTKVQKYDKDKFCYADSKYPIAMYLANKYKGIDKPTWDKNDIERETENAAERIANFIFCI